MIRQPNFYKEIDMFQSLRNTATKVALASTALMVSAVSTAAPADIDATQLTAGIEKAGPIIVAVGSAIFVLVGLLAAIRYAKRAAS